MFFLNLVWRTHIFNWTRPNKSTATAENMRTPTS